MRIKGADLVRRQKFGFKSGETFATVDDNDLLRCALVALRAARLNDIQARESLELQYFSALHVLSGEHALDDIQNGYRRSKEEEPTHWWFLLDNDPDWEEIQEELIKRDLYRRISDGLYVRLEDTSVLDNLARILGG